MGVRLYSSHGFEIEEIAKECNDGPWIGGFSGKGALKKLLKAIPLDGGRRGLNRVSPVEEEVLFFIEEHCGEIGREVGCGQT